MEKLIKRYVMQLLELQETKLKCINLGFNSDKNTKVELSLIEEAKKRVKNKL